MEAQDDAAQPFSDELYEDPDAFFAKLKETLRDDSVTVEPEEES